MRDVVRTTLYVTVLRAGTNSITCIKYTLYRTRSPAYQLTRRFCLVVWRVAAHLRGKTAFITINVARREP